MHLEYTKRSNKSVCEVLFPQIDVLTKA